MAEYMNRLLNELGPAMEVASDVFDVYLDMAKQLFAPMINTFEAAKVSVGPMISSASDATGQVMVLMLCLAGVALLAMAVKWVFAHLWSSGPSREQPSAIARHILLESEQMALAMKEELSGLKGSALLDKFGNFAVRHSDCSSGAVGGALGTVVPGKLAPAVDSLLWSAPLMVLQGPVQSDAGYHLVLVLQRSSGQPKVDQRAKKDS